VGDGIAEPVELRGVEANTRLAQCLVDGRALYQRANSGAVLGRHAVEIVSGSSGARARHVLRYHDRIAGNVPGPVARHRAGVEIVAAAYIEADDELDGFAREEIVLG